MIITIDDRAVLDALAQLRTRTNDFSPVLHDIGQALMEGSRSNIEQGHDWLGQANNAFLTLLWAFNKMTVLSISPTVVTRAHLIA